MECYRIAVLIGSLRKESLNRKLAEAAYKLAPPNLQFEEAVISDLPLYNQDYDDHQADSVKRLKSEISKAAGVLFVTPEYNHSVPGVLKNAIDHASRPPVNSAWPGKPAGVLGISSSPTGTCMAQQHLRNILAGLAVPMMCQPDAFFQDEDFFDIDGMPRGDKQDALRKWLKRYADWIAQHASKEHRRN